MINYTTIERIEKHKKIDIDSLMEPFVLNWISAMSRYADEYCNRSPLMVETSTTRKFSGTGTGILPIDEACEVVSVTDPGGNTIALSDLVTLPTNRTEIHNLYSDSSFFTKGVANYSVEAFYGYIKANSDGNGWYGNVPEDLSLAVTLLVGAIVDISRSGGDNVKSEKVGMYSYTTKDLEEKNDYKIAMGLLNQFRRLAI